MEPKQLAAMLEQKVAAEQEQKSKAKAESDAKFAALEAATEKAKNKFKDVVLPYLDNVQKAMPRGEFEYSVASMDAADNKPLSVKFRVRSGPTYSIVNSFGSIAVSHSGGANVPRGVKIVPSPVDEPKIYSAEHLTEENIGALIAKAIEES